MNLRRLNALMRKEAYQILRDPSAVLIAFVLPIILQFLFGFALSLDLDRTPIGVVLESPKPEARDLVASLASSRWFKVAQATDRREQADALVKGTLKGIVVIPAGFSREAMGQSPDGAIQILVDGSDPNTARFVQNYVQGAIATWRAAPMPVEVRSRTWFNQDLLSRNFLVPGSIALVMTMVGTLLTALVVAREWERGTMEAIMATPATALELLAGKLLPYLLLSMVSLSICVVAGTLVFHVPFRGSLPALYLLAICFMLPALGMGLVISAATRDQFQAAQIALLTGFLPAMLLSGFLFEIASMPWPIQALTMIVPARWLVPGLQTIFLAGDIWRLLLPHMAVLLLMGAVLLGLALKLSAKRLA